jgi:hypothetical protein
MKCRKMKPSTRGANLASDGISHAECCARRVESFCISHNQAKHAGCDLNLQQSSGRCVREWTVDSTSAAHLTTYQSQKTIRQLTRFKKLTSRAKSADELKLSRAAAEGNLDLRTATRHTRYKMNQTPSGKQAVQNKRVT